MSEEIVNCQLNDLVWHIGDILIRSVHDTACSAASVPKFLKSEFLKVVS